MRLLLRACLFALPWLLLMVAAYVWGPHISTIDYLGGIRAKQERLAALGSPKVVLIGGSNATFGMDSPLLEEALCRPVVNMTIHASLGFRFMVEQLEGGLGRGDLVIAPLEFSCYHDPSPINDTHMLALDRQPELTGFVPWYSRPRVFAGILVMRVQAVWKVWSGAWKDDSPHEVFRADGFNEQGDLISHLEMPVRPPDRIAELKYHSPTIDPSFWPVLERLQRNVEQSGAELIIAWPSVAESSFRPTASDSVRTALAEHGFTILGNAQNYVQADTAFYDTHYHLRATGRRIRTERLVKDLCSNEKVSCCR